MTTYTVLPQDDSQYDVTVTDTATYTVTAQDDSDLDVTITDTKAVTITLQPVTISGSGGVISVNGLTGAPSGAVIIDTDNIDEGTNNLYFTDERVDDRVNVLLQAGNGIRLDYNDEDGELEISSEQLEETVKNVSGGELTKGTPVYQSGTSGNFMAVAAADASSAAHMPAVGVLKETLADEAEGTMIIAGRIRQIDTSTFSEGDVVYVAPSGGYTNVRPSSENHLVQNLGRVTKVGQNGEGIVYGAGRSNDIPNLATGHVFIGNGPGYETRALTEADISDLQNYLTDYTVTQNDVTQHQAALSITESQISDLQNYLTAETNDLSSAVVWANVPDANITESSVTQHQAALTITESQISDLAHFSGSYNDLTDKDNFNTITLDTNSFFTVEGNFSGASVNSKFIPVNLDAFSGLGGNYGNLSDMFLANTWGTDNGHSVARFVASGTADDGSHNTQLILHGNAYNVINSWDVPTANAGVRKPLVYKANQHFIDSDNSEGFVAKFRHESTPGFQDESKLLLGWRKDDGTSIFGGTIATMYDSGDNWEFKFQGMDPDNDSTFNNLTIRKDYIYSDYPFKMTGYDNAGLASLSTNTSGALIWNTEDTKLEVYDGDNWNKIAMLQDTKDITLDDNNFLTVRGNFSAGGGAVDLSATGKYVPVNLSPLGGSIGTTDWFLAHSWGTDGGHSVGRLVAIGSSDDGSHNSALVLQGSNANQIISLDGNYNHKPLEIDSDKLKAPETSMVVNTTASEGGVLPLKIIRNNTDGGSTINDDSKVDVSFQIANGDSDYDNATFIGGFSAVYDTTNGNSFRLYVDPNQEATNPGSNSHEMQVHEDFFQISRPMQFSNYITSSVPPAADHNTRVIYVADGDQGSPCLAISDGSDWRVLATVGNVISIS